jgi:micrococcal nuclease
LAAVVLAGPAVAVDGDTLAVGAQRVRLWGIDAPELRTADGWRAKAAMVALLTRAGGQVTCEVKGLDRYGRTVARCSTAGAGDLAAALVAVKLARDWPEYSGGAYRLRP